MPSTSTGWCEPTATGSPFSTATIITVRPVAIRSRSAAVAAARLGRGVQRRLPDVGTAARVGEGDRGHPLVARQLGVVGADDVEPDPGRQQQLDRVGGHQQRQLVDAQAGRAGRGGDLGRALGDPLHGAGRPGRLLQGDGGRTSSAVTGPAPGRGRAG